MAWVRVRDDSELRPGSYELRNCMACGRRERLFLTREVPVKECALEHRTNAIVPTLPGERAFEHVGSCGDSSPVILTPAIREGRLFRFADEQLTEHDDRVSAPCDRERRM